LRRRAQYYINKRAEERSRHLAGIATEAEP
jgi:hypothetical protein